LCTAAYPRSKGGKPYRRKKLLIVAAVILLAQM
jgi:hypothetical protein